MLQLDGEMTRNYVQDITDRPACVCEYACARECVCACQGDFDGKRKSEFRIPDTRPIDG